MAYPFFLQLATVLLMVSLIMAAVFRMHHLAKRLDNVPVNQTYMGEDVTSVNQDIGDLLYGLWESVKVSSGPNLYVELYSMIRKYSLFAIDTTAAMLEEFNKGFFNEFY